MKKNKHNKWSEVPVLRHDLKALLFWAAVGIERSWCGSYQDAEGEDGIVDSYAKSIGYYLRPPKFGRLRKP